MNLYPVHFCPDPMGSHAPVRLPCDFYANATNPNATPKQLRSAAIYHPELVLAHPALDLLSLEDPTTIQAARQESRHALLSKKLTPLTQFQMPALRRLCIALVRLFVKSVSTWTPRYGIPLHPSIAIEMAEAELEGRVQRKALSWARHVALSFVEPIPRNDNDLTRVGNVIAKLCATTCAQTRSELLSGIWDALGYLCGSNWNKRYDEMDRIFADALAQKTDSKK